MARQKGSIQEHPFHPASLNGRFRNVLFMFYTLVLSFIFAFEIWGLAHHFADHFVITLRSHPPTEDFTVNAVFQFSATYIKL